MPEYDRVSAAQKENGISDSKRSAKNPLPNSCHPESIIQRARINPQSLTHTDILQLQKTIGIRAVSQLMQEIRQENAKPVQKKDSESANSTGLMSMPVPIQREEIPEEEELPLQGKFEVVQREEALGDEEEPLQMKRENQTGMPDQIKAGVENLSGMDMSDVRVHYNSDKPAGLGALAYTQGTDIHVAPGQERHLSHEAWHVVQQKQGRVQPTMQLKDVGVNDDEGLEREADVMGERMLVQRVAKASSLERTSLPVQRVASDETIQCRMGEREQEEITNWVRLHAAAYLVDCRPDMITDAPESQAVRLRWFSIPINGVNYLVGLNIHYLGTTIGGVWIKNLTTNDTLDFHPHANPQHGLGRDVLEGLRLHVQSFDKTLAIKISPSISSSSEGNVHIGNDDL